MIVSAPKVMVDCSIAPEDSLVALSRFWGVSGQGPLIMVSARFTANQTEPKVPTRR